VLELALPAHTPSRTHTRAHTHYKPHRSTTFTITEVVEFAYRVSMFRSEENSTIALCSLLPVNVHANAHTPIHEHTHERRVKTHIRVSKKERRSDKSLRSQWIERCLSVCARSCVCVCVRARVCVYLCVCICVWDVVVHRLAHVDVHARSRAHTQTQQTMAWNIHTLRASSWKFPGFGGFVYSLSFCPVDGTRLAAGVGTCLGSVLCLCVCLCL